MTLTKSDNMKLKWMTSKLSDYLVKNVKLYRMVDTIIHYDFFSFLVKKKDYKITINDNIMNVRVFFPKKKYKTKKAIIYYHGGGFVSGGINSYSRLCRRIVKDFNSIVILPEYRLAPEYKFPIPLNDAYMFFENLVQNDILNLHLEKYILMGDFTGANICVGVSYLANNNKLNISKQILLYPMTNYKYEDYKIFKSLTTYKTGYGLTVDKMNSFIDYYLPSNDERRNPLFAPLLYKNLKHQPKTLIVTAASDLLRDEGEAFKEKLKEDKVVVRYKCIDNAYHGFYNKKFNNKAISEANKIIEKFLHEK